MRRAAVKAGDPWPFNREGERWVAGRDTEFVRNGMPVDGLLVWLPEHLAERERQRAETDAQIRAAFGLPPATP